MGVDEERPRRRAHEHSRVGGEEEAEHAPHQADAEPEAAPAPAAAILEEDVERGQERTGAEKDERPGPRVHR